MAAPSPNSARLLEKVQTGSARLVALDDESEASCYDENRYSLGGNSENPRRSPSGEGAGNINFIGEGAPPDDKENKFLQMEGAPPDAHDAPPDDKENVNESGKPVDEALGKGLAGVGSNVSSRADLLASRTALAEVTNSFNLSPGMNVGLMNHVVDDGLLLGSSMGSGGSSLGGEKVSMLKAGFENGGEIMKSGEGKLKIESGEGRSLTRTGSSVKKRDDRSWMRAANEEDKEENSSPQAVGDEEKNPDVVLENPEEENDSIPDAQPSPMHDAMLATIMNNRLSNKSPGDWVNDSVDVAVSAGGDEYTTSLTPPDPTSSRVDVCDEADEEIPYISPSTDSRSPPKELELDNRSIQQHSLRLVGGQLLRCISDGPAGDSSQAQHRRMLPPSPSYAAAHAPAGHAAIEKASSSSAGTLHPPGEDDPHRSRIGTVESQSSMEAAVSRRSEPRVSVNPPAPLPPRVSVQDPNPASPSLVDVADLHDDHVLHELSSSRGEGMSSRGEDLDLGSCRVPTPGFMRRIATELAELKRKISGPEVMRAQDAGVGGDEVVYGVTTCGHTHHVCDTTAPGRTQH